MESKEIGYNDETTDDQHPEERDETMAEKKDYIYIADASLFGDLSEKHEKMHQHLSEIVKDLPEDYEPYGQQKREEPCKDEEDAYYSYSDCSCGCRFFAKLEGDLGKDWGVCANPASHRCGLLTFEHQGCTHFDPEEDEE